MKWQDIANKNPNFSPKIKNPVLIVVGNVKCVQGLILDGFAGQKKMPVVEKRIYSHINSGDCKIKIKRF